MDKRGDLSLENNDQIKSRISKALPKLGTFEVVRAATNRYNCFAWAAGRDDRPWGPSDKPYYWPDHVAKEESLLAYQAAFRSLGYESCFIDEIQEEGFEKIAIFARGVVPSHASRQLANGWWTSKLGDNWVIEHENLRGLEGPLYGRVALVMKRPLDASPPEQPKKAE
jgi:hypothetical protein